MASQTTQPLPSEHDEFIEAVLVQPEMSARQKAWLIFLVLMKRARFFAVLLGIGFFIVYWDSIKLHWDRLLHPRAAAVKDVPQGKEFFCPMDPQVMRSGYEANGDVPECPICGMPLSLHDKPGPDKFGNAKLPEGVTGRVSLAADRVTMARIKTAEIGYRPMLRRIKTVGYVTFDESGLSQIVSRVDGYVEKLYADKSYTVVQKGDPLAEIYSPELYSAASEMAAAKARGDREFVASSRRKLILLGVSPEDIDRMTAAGEPATTMLIRSPRSGHVIDKKIVAGASVQAKMPLFDVADLSTVWIEADVYENDAPFVEAGQEIAATVESYPNRVFRGKVALVHPHLEAATRTNRVRIKLDNPNHDLRPGMYAEVAIEIPLETIEPYKSLAAKAGRMNGTQQEFLAVPETAVIDTGTKKIVYVERAPGQFEGLEVELGPRNDAFYPVLKGLAGGDRVAAAGSFLVDAETRLNPAAASLYFGATGGGQGGKEVGWAELASPTKSAPHPAPTPGNLKNIEQLPSAEDRELATRQAVCPITGNALGAMGVPVKIELRGKPVFLCCKGCVGKAKRDPDATLKKLER